MSLNWDLTGIKNHEEVCFVGEGDERRLHGVTHTLIMCTLGVGIGEITNKNWREFYRRIHVQELVWGPFTQMRIRSEDGEEQTWSRFITAKDIFKHIGLKTNAHFKQTDGRKFLKSLLKAIPVYLDEEFEDPDNSERALYALRVAFTPEELGEMDEDRIDALQKVLDMLDAKWKVGRAARQAASGITED